ncbi:MAG: hypothetical protein BA861_04110 [Desulfobacterales bacterium S3730MH5]|nr:MAG: hypothetical protein BA861_04110 [Desulfobacterales bacterium S3730MH5]
MAVVNVSGVIPSNVLPSEVVFWTGAGISAGSPSNLPLGDPLSRDVIGKFCLAGIWDKLLWYYDKTRMTDAYGVRKWSPRLEAVIECLMGVYGLGVLDDLWPYYDAEPNPVHGFLAAHLRHGGVSLTANFDNCIEKVLFPVPVSPMGGVIDQFPRRTTLTVGPGHILHFHGKFDRDPDKLRQLGVRINTISSGFPEFLKDEILRILRSAPFLVFAGYSGRDYFDVNPFFREVAERGTDLKGLRVVWVKHDRRDGFLDVSGFSGQEHGKAVLGQLERCGADIKYVQVKTDDFLRGIAERWWGVGVWNVPQRSRWPRHPGGKTSLSADSKIIATAHLYSWMGVGSEIIALKDELVRIRDSALGPGRDRVTLLLNEGFRASGFYRKALKYSKTLQSGSLRNRIFRHERIAGDYWLRGSQVMAAYHFWKAIVQELKSLSHVPLSERRSALFTFYEILITFLHWYRDVRKIRFVGRILPARLALKAFQKLFHGKKYLMLSIGSRTKVQRLHTEIPDMASKITLPRWLRPDTGDLISPFRETDSILGVINFTRRHLVGQVDKGVKPEKVELELLLARSKTILDRPGVLKAAMMLKQEHGIRDADALKFLKEIEWTWVSKLSWMTSWILPAW